MRIDAHHHFIDLERFSYPWLGPEIAPLQRNFVLTDLQPQLNEHHIDATILVQTISTLDETKHFLDIGNADNAVAGIIGWVDLCAKDIEQQVIALKQYGPLVGIRHQVHDEPDDQWLLRPDVLHGLAVLEKQQLPYDLLIRPQHLPVALEVVKCFPQLRFIIDHVGKPAIKDASFDQDWADGMKHIAAHNNVWCKLSGMSTEADWESWSAKDLKPYITAVLEMFGVERLIFGSDWPVCLLAGSYTKTISALEEVLQETLTKEEQASIFGRNAIDCYQLNVST